MDEKMQIIEDLYLAALVIADVSRSARVFADKLTDVKNNGGSIKEARDLFDQAIAAYVSDTCGIRV